MGLTLSVSDLSPPWVPISSAAMMGSEASTEDHKALSDAPPLSRTDPNRKLLCQACGSPHPAPMALPSINASQGWLWTLALSARAAGLPGTGTSMVLHREHLLWDRVDLDVWPHIWQDEWWRGGPAPLPHAFPDWGRKCTERLSARSSSSWDGWRGGLSSRQTTYKRFLCAAWVWAWVSVLWRAGPHRKSSRPMRDAANCLCLLGRLLPLGRSHPCTLSKVDCKNTAQASAGHGKGKRAVCGNSCCKLLYK